MKILAIDTCGAESTLAMAEVGAEGLSQIEQSTLPGRSCAEQILPGLRSLLAAEHATLAQVRALVVVRGPGSFTGVRVGVSTTKAFAQALKLPVVGLSRLQVLAHASGARAALLDAGRGEFYWGALGEEPAEALLTAEAVREQLTRRGWAEADLACCEEVVAKVFPFAQRVAAPTAVEAARLAEARLMQRDFDDIAAMDGHYLRRSQAEVVAAAQSAQQTLASAQSGQGAAH